MGVCRESRAAQEDVDRVSQAKAVEWSGRFVEGRDCVRKLLCAFGGFTYVGHGFLFLVRASTLQAESAGNLCGWELKTVDVGWKGGEGTQRVC